MKIKVINCYFQNYFLTHKPPPLLIMAGGFGKRLGILTKQCPKPMLKLNNKPILEHIIDKAKKRTLLIFIFLLIINLKSLKIILVMDQSLM